MTSLTLNSSNKPANNNSKQDSKGFSITLGDTYLGYIIISKKLDKDLVAKITEDTLKAMLKDVQVQQFEEKKEDTSLNKYFA